MHYRDFLTFFLFLKVVRCKFGRKCIDCDKAEPGQVPWQVSLQVYSNGELTEKEGWEHLCGGSLITFKAIATAAHCFNDLTNKKEWSAVAGNIYRSEGERRGLSQIFIHPEYENSQKIENRPIYNYDYAVVFAEIPFEEMDDGHIKVLFNYIYLLSRK